VRDPPRGPQRRMPPKAMSRGGVRVAANATAVSCSRIDASDPHRLTSMGWDLPADRPPTHCPGAWLPPLRPPRPHDGRPHDIRECNGDVLETCVEDDLAHQTSCGELRACRCPADASVLGREESAGTSSRARPGTRRRRDRAGARAETRRASSCDPAASTAAARACSSCSRDSNTERSRSPPAAASATPPGRSGSCHAAPVEPRRK
jgi:hypothetical protein